MGGRGAPPGRACTPEELRGRGPALRRRGQLRGDAEGLPAGHPGAEHRAPGEGPLEAQHRMRHQRGALAEAGEDDAL